MLTSYFNFALLVALFLGSQNAFSQAPSSDIMQGEKIYQQCIACHSPSYHRTGPKHCNILNRQAGTVSNFDFTTAMKESKIIWTKVNLDLFLKAPLEMIPETSMGISGISSAKERQQLISYLASLNNEHSACQ